MPVLLGAVFTFAVEVLDLDVDDDFVDDEELLLLDELDDLDEDLLEDLLPPPDLPPFKI